MILEDILVGMNSEPCWSKMKRLASNNFEVEISLVSKKFSVIFHNTVVMIIKAIRDVQTSHDTILINKVKSNESCLEIGMYASDLSVQNTNIHFMKLHKHSILHI